MFLFSEDLVVDNVETPTSADEDVERFAEAADNSQSPTVAEDTDTTNTGVHVIKTIVDDTLKSSVIPVPVPVPVDGAVNVNIINVYVDVGKRK